MWNRAAAFYILSTSKLVDMPQLQTIITRNIATPPMSVDSYSRSGSCQPQTNLSTLSGTPIRSCNIHANMCATHLAHFTQPSRLLVLQNEDIDLAQDTNYVIRLLIWYRTGNLGAENVQGALANAQFAREKLLYLRAHGLAHQHAT